jgi:hypothetical protein
VIATGGGGSTSGSQIFASTAAAAANREPTPGPSGTLRSLANHTASGILGADRDVRLGIASAYIRKTPPSVSIIC